MAACKVCEEPLVLVLEPEEEDEETLSFPDDLELQCRCHFHWQCLLDQSTEILSSLKCPVCESSLGPVSAGGSSSATQSPPDTILTTYTNEGGVQQNLNIFSDLTEEAYIEAHPEAGPARAMHVMCAEGETSGVVELLQNMSEEMEETELASMLRYRDPFAAGSTALHLAIENFHEETIWLLLWIASQLPTERFPEAARRDAESVGLRRSTASIGSDIRGVRNESGQTAGDIARNLGGIWAPFISNGILDP